MDRISQYLEERKATGNYRSLKVVSGLVDFSSNDYLGLSRSAWVAQQTAEAMQAYQWFPQGATASRLLNGNSKLLEGIEEDIASFHQAEAALVFNSGYDANIGLISTVVRPEDIVFLDEYCHASLYQGAKLSGAQIVPFRHNDTVHLQELVSDAAKTQVKWIITESLFSMDGDRAPLQQLATISKKRKAYLMVDEAHATGIYGPSGRGLCIAAGIADDCFARIFTFGKALGAHGAAVVGAEVLKSYLINFAKPLIYSTALPIHSLLRIKMAYQYLGQKDKQRHKLLENIAHFNVLKAKIPYQVVGDGPIFGVIIPGNDIVKAMANSLQEAGFDVRPIVSPTVPKGTERIRLTMHSFNSTAEINSLTAILASNLGSV